MPPVPRPTEAELMILDVLWRRRSATVREVHDELAPQRGTGYTTTLKIMQMMLQKGLLKRGGNERQHVYRAALPAAKAQRQILGPLIDRLFAGSTSALVQQALDSRRVDAAELAAIRQMLDEYALASAGEARKASKDHDVD